MHLKERSPAPSLSAKQEVQNNRQEDAYDEGEIAKLKL